MLDILDYWLRVKLERNYRLSRAEKAQGYLAYSLDPTDHKGGFSSGRNIQTEIQSLVRKERLSDMMVNSGVMEKHS